MHWRSGECVCTACEPWASTRIIHEVSNLVKRDAKEVGGSEVTRNAKVDLLELLELGVCVVRLWLNLLELLVIRRWILLLADRDLVLLAVL